MRPGRRRIASVPRSEEHTSELQSRFDLVCRLLLEKKKKRVDHQRRGNRSGALFARSALPLATGLAQLSRSPDRPGDLKYLDSGVGAQVLWSLSTSSESHTASRTRASQRTTHMPPTFVITHVLTRSRPSST